MYRNVKKIVKPVFAICIAFSVLVFGAVGMMNAYLPDRYVVADGSELTITSLVPITSDQIVSDGAASAAADAGREYGVQLKLMGIIPLKKATVRESAVMNVVPLGKSFGVKIFSKGVLVVGIQSVDTKSGTVSPGEKAGLLAGDIIEAINGTEPQNSGDVAGLIEASGGAEMKLTVNRGGSTVTFSVTPVLSESDGRYKLGLWVRDSSAGIGTLTFYSPEYNIVAGLGHAVCDIDTGSVFPVSDGEMVNSKIFAVVKGRSGSPGELKGRFAFGSIGRILLNSETGVYAVPSSPFPDLGSVEVAHKQEVAAGDAQILTTLDSGAPERYSITIEKITYNDTSNVKNMIIRVTDRALLEKTGGIVQGMSGSPIIQNGKLVGAVTHVLVNDPTKGYAIFAENMLETAQSVAEEQKLKDAS